MPVNLAKGFAVALAAAAMLHPALARDDYGFRDIMVEEGGRKPPAKKQKGSETKKDTEPGRRPRGSSYIPSTNLPRTEPVVVTPSPGIYKPPPINSFSDRITNCNHSFPLNAGIGNNPTDRSSYVRQCAN